MTVSEPSEAQKFPLTGFSFGIWKARKRRVSLHVLHEQRKFVFVVENVSKSRSKGPNRIEKAISETVNSVLDLRSPFSHSADSFEGEYPCVIAFEISWADIAGLDYRNCLLKNGRLVLEAKHVTKWVFPQEQETQNGVHSSAQRFAAHAKSLSLDFNSMANSSSSALSIFAAAQNSFSRPSSAPVSPINGTMRRRNTCSNLAAASPSPLKPTGSDPLITLSSLSAPSSHPLSPQTVYRTYCVTADDEFFTPAASPSHDGRAKSPVPTMIQYSPVPPHTPEYAVGSCCSDASPQESQLRPTTSSSMGDGLVDASMTADDQYLPHLSPALSPTDDGERSGVSKLCLRLTGSSLDFEALTGSSDLISQRSFDFEQAASQAEPVGTFSHVSLVATFNNSELPACLGACIQDDLRLLKMYESGLPGWAILLPSYGFFYRPWMRRATWGLFLGITLFSMAMGFYDLYKNMPYLRELAASIAAQFRFTPVWVWLQAHAEFRLSLIVTYLFGRSPVLMACLRVISFLGQCIFRLLRPLLMLILAFFNPLGKAVRLFSLHILQTCVLIILNIVATVQWIVTPPTKAILALLLMLAKLLYPVADTVQAFLLVPTFTFCTTIFDVLLLPWQYTRAMFSIIPTLASMFRSLSSAAATAQAAPGLMHQRNGLLHLLAIPWDAVLLLRVTLLRIVRSAQAILNFFVTMGTTLNKHRLSINIQIRGKWVRMKGRCLKPLQGTRLMVWIELVSSWMSHRYQAIVPPETPTSPASDALITTRPLSPILVNQLLVLPQGQLNREESGITVFEDAEGQANMEFTDHFGGFRVFPGGAVSDGDKAAADGTDGAQLDGEVIAEGEREGVEGEIQESWDWQGDGGDTDDEGAAGGATSQQHSPQHQATKGHRVTSSSESSAQDSDAQGGDQQHKQQQQCSDLDSHQQKQGSFQLPSSQGLDGDDITLPLLPSVEVVTPFRSLQLDRAISATTTASNDASSERTAETITRMHSQDWVDIAKALLEKASWPCDVLQGAEDSEKIEADPHGGWQPEAERPFMSVLA